MTGTGETFMTALDPDGFELEEEDLEHWAYEYAYKDGRINVAALVNDLEIPSLRGLSDVLKTLEPGQKIELVFLRGGEEIRAETTLEAR